MEEGGGDLRDGKGSREGYSEAGGAFGGFFEDYGGDLGEDMILLNNSCGDLLVRSKRTYPNPSDPSDCFQGMFSLHQNISFVFDVGGDPFDDDESYNGFVGPDSTLCKNQQIVN